jgi:hypothetical protein
MVGLVVRVGVRIGLGLGVGPAVGVVVGAEAGVGKVLLLLHRLVTYFTFLTQSQEHKMTIQQQIDDERMAIQILGIFVHQGNEILWTRLMLEQLSPLSLVNINRALDWLLSYSYVDRIRTKYIMTEIGREYYLNVCGNPRVIVDSHEFKNEVLTGLTEETSRKSGYRVSKRTAIDKPALPKVGANRGHLRTPEQVLCDAQHREAVRQRIIADLCVSEEEYDRLNAEGRIRYCRGLKDGRAHVGIFDKQRHRFRYLCRECRKQKRRNK